MPTVTFKECCEVGVYINPYFTDEETEAERYLTQITVGICAEGVLICAEIKTTGSYSPR